VKVNVCVGTNCFMKGSQSILSGLLQTVEQKELQGKVELSASFCFERCGQGPTVEIDGKQLHNCTPQKACAALEDKLKDKS
jgi:NADH-quinone oxidoreductase subunit G